MLDLLKIIGAWLLAIPAPTASWATIVAAWAWPVAILVIAYWFRKPLEGAAGALAARFANDDIKIGSILEVTRNTLVVPLDGNAPAAESDVFSAEDRQLIERMLEFVGESDGNEWKLIAWIANNVGSAIEPEAFITQPQFAEQREKAYKELQIG